MIQQELRNAVERSLAEDNKRIIEYNGIYVAAKDFVESFGEEKLRDYKKRICDPKVIRILEDAATSQRQVLAKKVGNGSLCTEVIVNLADGIELFVPVRQKPAVKTGLEKAILAHITETASEVGCNIRSGKIGEFVSLGLYNPKIKSSKALASALRGKICSLPEEMNLAKVEIRPYAMMLPVFGSCISDRDSITIRLTPSSIQYQLIPVRRKDAEFFPPYKHEFTLETCTGNVFAWVTSQTPAKGKGNYICGSRRDGTLGDAMSKLGLNERSRVRIAALEPHKRYSLEKVQ